MVDGTDAEIVFPSLELVLGLELVGLIEVCTIPNERPQGEQSISM